MCVCFCCSSSFGCVLFLCFFFGVCVLLLLLIFNTIGAVGHLMKVVKVVDFFSGEGKIDVSKIQFFYKKTTGFYSEKKNQMIIFTAKPMYFPTNRVLNLFFLRGEGGYKKNIKILFFQKKHCFPVKIII